MIDLTGIWQGDDGGTYVVRQIQDAVWWLGLSKDNPTHPELDSEDGIFYPGLQFCNVFRGRIIQQLVYGQWSDVPRGLARNYGDLTLLFVDGRPDEQQLTRDVATGGFGGSSWRRVLTEPTVRSAGELFKHTYKDVRPAGRNQENLDDSLRLIVDSVSLIGTVAQSGTDEQRNHVVSMNYPWNRGIDYRSFICGGDGDGGHEDGDATFFVLADQENIGAWQTRFLVGVNQDTRDEVASKITSPLEAEIIMYGRGPDCQHARADTPAQFPGWAEAGGSSVLFNGRPIQIRILPPGVGSNVPPGFLEALAYGDAVRVTGAMVIDHGHFSGPDGLEIHPVYSVDRITSALSNNLSGAWSDDDGNTYYFGHDQVDNSVWYAGLSPVGSEVFGQVFHGAFDPTTSTVAGEMAALSFGFEKSSPPMGFSRTDLGGTGRIEFRLSVLALLNRQVHELRAGNFNLAKLYDAPATKHVPLWRAWEDLGGAITGPLTTVSWGPNRLDIFGVDTNCHVQHMWFDPTLPNTVNGWGAGWEDLGGAITGPLTTVSWGPNRLDIFGVDTNRHVQHMWFDPTLPNTVNGWGAGWEDLGGAITGPLTTVSWGPNRLDIFGVVQSGVLHLWFG
jgi:hypothetical protein